MARGDPGYPSFPIEEANRDLQTNFKRQFATLSSEFRGHSRVMVEDMNAYMRVSPHLCGYMRAYVMSLRDELEKDALDAWDAECISTQRDTNLAQEWNTRRVSVPSGLLTFQL